MSNIPRIKIEIADLVDIEPYSGAVVIKDKKGAHFELNINEVLHLCNAYLSILNRLRGEIEHASIH